MIGSARNYWLARAAIFGLFLCSATAHASKTQIVIKGPSSLRVKVLDHRERPVQGAAVVLDVFVTHGTGAEKEIERKELAQFKTNENGEIIIGKLGPGDYEINLKEDVNWLSENSFRLKVTKDSKGQGEIVFHWPFPEKVIVTNTLSGTLRRWETAASTTGLEKILNRSKGRGQILAVPLAELSLFRFFSNEKVTEARTDEMGRFDFRVAESGLYYMRLKFGTGEETIVLDLDRDFVGAAPVVDVLIEDFIINGDAPEYRSLNGGIISPRTEQ